ncbi:MAG: hypothetical protein BWZ08_01195 [candidate division BRC1 bacterium ADurb.BinA292]|nr:MAG: hypothetical protein BWZ08_01195 [candidate division BRC1 bacterium ADurb.BinA292]
MMKNDLTSYLDDDFATDPLIVEYQKVYDP